MNKWKIIYENWFVRMPKKSRRTKSQILDLRFQAKLFAEIFPDRFEVKYTNIGNSKMQCQPKMSI